ncbi:hypothetical protein BDW02DRAFT_613998 [Decorospora gaudefroyi]|uniref:Zn(2)-C6 fungal-type domain-containing protein n=1 Tax=Decorospora gaudefroyi TaxID=184978 RepID=A0A6A5KF61_9PLEO|nr:hypothetical protein BDW02DRAFT_613998 [Decorospora gaudefroyi]
MDRSLDGSMPPRPDVEFDFNLPHDIDAEHDMHQSSSDTQGYQDDMEDIRHTAEPNDSFSRYKQNIDEQHLNYNVLPKGFSDDEDTEEGFDSFWSSHQARTLPPKNKKSPKRSSEDGDDEASPMTKKFRKSLFGGSAPAEEDEEAHVNRQPQYHPPGQEDDLHEPKTPGLRNPMTSLTLEQKEREETPFERPFNLGFGLETSDRGSISPTPAPEAAEGNLTISPDTRPVYDFRQNIERKKTFTYVDQDNSGNFDPIEDAKRNFQRAKAAKAAKAAQPKKGKREPRENIMKCIVNLEFKAFGNVRNITNDEDNWPEDWSDIDSDTERELQEYRDFFRHCTPGCETQLPIEDPSGQVDDMTGYPVARGCKACRKHGLDCSMVDGGTYPCQQCLDENDRCEPIVPPTENGYCKQCVDDGQEFCSFENDPDQAICDYCSVNDLICEALPPTEYRAHRIRIDEIMYGEDRPYAACTVCRREKKRCSLKKKTDKPPCKYCKKHSIGCTFYDIPKTEHKKKGKGIAVDPTEGEAPEVSMPDSAMFSPEDLADLFSKDEEWEESRSPTPEVEMEDAEGHRGKLFKIKTSFAHPIKFSGLANTTDCNFCELPSFGFVGHFEKEAHVIRWYGGLGYTEVAGGHAENHGSTTLCQSCTIGRAQIISCPEHDMRHMFPNDTIPNFDETFSDLLDISDSPSPADVQAQLQRWCSMCFSPATFICCESQISLFSADDEDTIITGCGLRLCSRCEFKLREVFDGDTSVMAATLDREPKAKKEDEDMDGQIVRADVGFLSAEGLLMKNLENQANQADL